MDIQWEPFTVTKRSPLTISRGTTATSTNLWIQISADGITGWGEATPFVHGIHDQSTEVLQAAITALVPELTAFHPLDRQVVEQYLGDRAIPSALRAAIDLALHDWLGKRAGLPLWQLWGLARSQIPPISVTVGISSLEAARQRVRDWRSLLPVQMLKVKLGSPAGLEADRAMFSAVQEEAPDLPILVDANAGWDLSGAIAMAEWLGDRGVAYLEQPLPVGADADWLVLHERSPLPLFADESCFSTADIPRLASFVDGINIKLMKCGGLAEAWRMLHTARACGLQVMFGCYSDSALANTAALQLGALADYLDLDSHLNLIDDPFGGAIITSDGHLLPPEQPGLGVSIACAGFSKNS